MNEDCVSRSKPEAQMFRVVVNESVDQPKTGDSPMLRTSSRPFDCAPFDSAHAR